MANYKHLNIPPEDIEANYTIVYYTVGNVPILNIPKFAHVDKSVKDLNKFVTPKEAYKHLGKVIPIVDQTEDDSSYLGCIAGLNPNKITSLVIRYIPAMGSFLSFDCLFKAFSSVRDGILNKTNPQILSLPVFSDWRFSDVYTGLFTSIFNDIPTLTIVTYEAAHLIMDTKNYMQAPGCIDDIPF